jgi:hypothetical protein
MATEFRAASRRYGSVSLPAENPFRTIRDPLAPGTLAYEANAPTYSAGWRCASPVPQLADGSWLSPSVLRVDPPTGLSDGCAGFAQRWG